MCVSWGWMGVQKHALPIKLNFFCIKLLYSEHVYRYTWVAVINDRVRGSVQPAKHGALMEVLSANLLRKGGVSWKINFQDRK